MKIHDRIVASMLLAAVGDAVGFRSGRWEFLKDGEKIHKEFEDLGGLTKIVPDGRKIWCVSDDTVMHMATARALVNPKVAKVNDFHLLISVMTQEYIDCMKDMDGRAPGLKCVSSLNKLQNQPANWDKLSYDRAGGGCGGSMRSMCIGLRFFGPQRRHNLIRTSIESGRITHNHATGFMGAFVAAAFTALALEDVPPRRWGYLLINELIPQCREYLQNEAKRDWEQIDRDVNHFSRIFSAYLKERGILNDGDDEAKFPTNYGIKERDAYYKKWSYDGWAGASGDDSVIIAYDALLGSKGDYLELIKRGVLHYGDNDSTGTICLAWYGALYGLPSKEYEGNYKTIEYHDELVDLANKIYDLTQQD
jgi:ADP-ribosylarginine hydrolase